MIGVAEDISILSVICILDPSSRVPTTRCSLTSIHLSTYRPTVQRFPSASFPLRVVRVVLWGRGSNSTEL